MTILQAGGNMGFLLMMVGMFVVMYFFMIRPQQKKQKELKNFRANLAVGDKVVTIGGIHGKVLEVTDTTILLSCEGGKIRFSKSAVAQTVSEQLEA